MDVLIVEDEPALLESLQDGLQGAFPGYTFRGVPSVELAENLLDESAVPSLIVSDIRLPGKSGLEFLVDVRRRQPDAKFILMSAFPSSVPAELAEASKGIRFLRKPFDLARLVEEVQDALEGERFTGSVEGITLIDLLQILHMGKRSAQLKIKRGNRAGAIFVDDGEIVHAVLGTLEGIDAFNDVVHWSGGSYSVESDAVPPRRTIEESFSFLLLEAMRLADEQERENGDSTQGASEDDGSKPRAQPSGQENKRENKRMADLNELCKNLVDNAPDAVAANVVDLSTGMMMGGFFHSNFTTDHFEAVSAAATNLYRGRETLRVESLVKAQRGDTSDTHFMEEVQFSTTHMHHFLVKLPGKEAILCLVTKRPGNIGMGWSAVRAAINEVTALVPS